MEHAKLSPSSSARWLTCTKSVEMEGRYPDSTNSASEWGSVVHEIGERLLKGESLSVGDTVCGTTIDSEMVQCAVEYVEYVKEFITPESKVLIEERFDLSFIAPDTFGTGDATVLTDTTLHIFDLKTGRNRVEAAENTQLMMYALGALHKFKNEYIEDITLHIVQTRIGIIDTWNTSINRLEDFSAFVKKQAEKILKGDTEYCPSDKACKWCKHMANCEALYKFTEEVIKGEFDNIEDINEEVASREHIKRILDNKELIFSFIEAIESKAVEMLNNGEKIEGYKIVESRTNRKWADEAKDKIEKYLIRKLKKEGAFKQTLITPTQAIKKLDDSGKKYIEKFIVKPKGRAIVVPATDKRPAIESVKDEFDNL